MKNFITTGLFLISFFVSGQNYNHAYSIINLFNTSNDNPHDVIFSYDVINGTPTCMNNFEIVSKMNADSSFNFRIFLNDVAVYTGSVSLPAYERYFFDNAFVNCNSTTSIIRVVIL